MGRADRISIESEARPRLVDESSHEASGLEWWFAQGHYEGPRSGKRCFMVTLFRQNAERGSGRGKNAFSLLISVLNPETGRQETLSQVDPATVRMLAGSGSRLCQTNIDPRFAEAYISEVRAYGPPRPIRLERTRASLTTKPFSVTWKGFSLRQSKTGFLIDFTEPGSKRRCRIRLRPSRPRMYIKEFRVADVKRMEYTTYPRLGLSGTTGGERVKGGAWFDHQWGDFEGWFVTDPAKGRILGWNWFGINLSDGSDLLIMVHNDMRTGKALARYVFVRGRTGRPRVYRNFSTEPVRYWRSPATHAEYPVAWRIRIPGIKADLLLEPFTDDQEIRFFGMMRSVWEGAGRVSGTAAGRKVKGTARVELHGYGYIFDFRKYLEHAAGEIDGQIERYFPKTIDEGQLRKYVGPAHWEHETAAHTWALARPIWDIMLRRGKHWRPIFGMLMLEALGVPSGPYDQMISVMAELCHTGALIIDDIQDNSRIRRGDACIHLRYGVDIAINAANTIYFLPFLILSQHRHLTEKQRLEIFRIVTKFFVRSHFGQGLDIYWSRNISGRNLSSWMRDGMDRKILQMYSYKTSTAIQAVAEVGCVIAGSGKKTRGACISFARTFGVAFQIIDDVLNFSDSPKWSKTPGEDLLTGKPTYVIIRALESLKGTDRRRLRDILTSETLRKKAPVLREGIGLVRGSGALDACRSEAQEMIATEWESLSRKLPFSEPKILLRMLCRSLLDLAHEV